MIRVMLVDDHPVVRSGLRAVLEAEADLSVVGEVSSGEEALEAFAALLPDVVLCDVQLGDGIDGIRTTAQIREFPNPPVVVMLSTSDRDADIFRSLEAGAGGYLLKDASPESIIAGVRHAAKGETYLPPELAARVVAGMHRPLPQLTQREVEVLQQLAVGASNREIAHDLFVSEATVKSHLAHLFSKLQVDSRSRAVHAARDLGLI